MKLQDCVTGPELVAVVSRDARVWTADAATLASLHTWASKIGGGGPAGQGSTQGTGHHN